MFTVTLVSYADVPRLADILLQSVIMCLSEGNIAHR